MLLALGVAAIFLVLWVICSMLMAGGLAEIDTRAELLIWLAITGTMSAILTAGSYFFWIRP